MWYIGNFVLGVIHILRKHQGGGGFEMITLMLFFALSMPNLITEGGGGLETDFLIENFQIDIKQFIQDNIH